MQWDGGSYDGPLSLVSVGNGQRTGGVFFMTPHANPFDGKLTFMYGYRSTRLGMFQVLPNAMKPGAGNMVEMEGIHHLRTLMANCLITGSVILSIRFSQRLFRC
jgi:diacylglycerol kinase family enzyme